MKKVLALLLALVMVFSLAACGGDGSESAEKKPEATNTETNKTVDGNGETNKEAADNGDTILGEWIGVGGDSFGFSMTATDAAAYTITLEEGGKGSTTLDSDPMDIEWSQDGDKITVTVIDYDTTSEGTLTDGALYFEDYVGFGVNIYLAKEGTPAFDPGLYIPEEDKAMVGTWTSYKVTDVLEEDVSDVMAADALVMTLNGDYTAEAELNGEVIESTSWTLYDGFGYLTESEYDISWDVKGDEIVVAYYTDEDAFYFTCSKSDN